jgi:hypothetical protein
MDDSALGLHLAQHQTHVSRDCCFMSRPPRGPSARR